MVTLDEAGSSPPVGRGTGEVVWTGSEGSAGALAFFFAGGFLATGFVAEDEGSAAGEGWAVDAD